jgi:predicted MFS family arabinose efflux permease
MQAIVSKPLGRIIEQHGFRPVLLAFSLLPLIAYGLLWTMIPRVRSEAGPVLVEV